MNDDLIREYADKLIEAIGKASGPAADAALLYAWSGALTKILFGFGSAVALAVLFAFWRQMWLPWVRRPAVADPLGDKTFGIGASAFGLFVVAFIFCVLMLDGLLDARAWVALWHPEVWLIHEALR